MLKLDWEEKNYNFDASDCTYRWQDIRMIALRSELERYPEARPGDLLVTFRGKHQADKILDHFNDSYDNFRHGSLEPGDSTSTVNVILAPVARPYVRG
ncbi:MAG TPA: hypothetical protein VIK02_01365 [Candidatus Anoxymicrobiaceae bacterium]